MPFITEKTLMRLGDRLYRAQHLKSFDLWLEDVQTGEVTTFEDVHNNILDDLIPYREAKVGEFHDAVQRILKPKQHIALKAAGLSIPDQCTFVARQAFLGSLVPRETTDDVALVQQTLWHLSCYDGTTGLR
jgi:hypothetical protein